MAERNLPHCDCLQIGGQGAGSPRQGRLICQSLCISPSRFVAEWQELPKPDKKTRYSARATAVADYPRTSQPTEHQPTGQMPGRPYLQLGPDTSR